MASIKVIFRTSSPQDCEGTLYYRIIHKRKVRQIHTGIRISKSEWNEEECMVTLSGTASRQEYLNAVQNKLDENVTRLKRVVNALDNAGTEYTASDVVEQYHKSDTVIGFISFARKLISENKDMGKVSAVAHYSSALNSFIRYHGESEVSFDEFDSKLMAGYEHHLKTLNLTPNTISFYMRKLLT